MSKKVLVTGANGFIGSQIVADLLKGQFDVVAAMRNATDPQKTRHLLDLPGAKERLKLVELDLANKQQLFESYMGGLDYIIHTASPYTLDVDNPKEELVDPAIDGVIKLLDAAKYSKTIKRIVMTSSMAAVTDEPDARKTLTESDWNTKSSLTRNPYYYSKTMAEHSAWKFVEKNTPKWDLVVINPYMTIGPQLDPKINHSNSLFLGIATGKMPAIMPLTWGFVDVRDVANAHILAMLSKNAKGRYLCVAEKKTMRSVVDQMKSLGFGVDKLPSRSLEGWLGRKIARLITYTLPKGTGTYLRTHLGKSATISTEKITKDLGIEFRPLDKTLADTFEFLQSKL